MEDWARLHGGLALSGGDAQHRQDVQAPPAAAPDGGARQAQRERQEPDRHVDEGVAELLSHLRRMQVSRLYKFLDLHI